MTFRITPNSCRARTLTFTSLLLACFRSCLSSSYETSSFNVKSLRFKFCIHFFLLSFSWNRPIARSSKVSADVSKLIKSISVYLSLLFTFNFFDSAIIFFRFVSLSRPSPVTPRKYLTSSRHFATVLVEVHSSVGLELDSITSPKFVHFSTTTIINSF